MNSDFGLGLSGKSKTQFRIMEVLLRLHRMPVMIAITILAANCSMQDQQPENVESWELKGSMFFYTHFNSKDLCERAKEREITQAKWEGDYRHEQLARDETCEIVTYAPKN